MKKEIEIHKAHEDYQQHGKITPINGDNLARQWAEKKRQGCLPAILIGLSPALIYLLNQLATHI